MVLARSADADAKRLIQCASSVGHSAGGCRVVKASDQEGRTTLVVNRQTRDAIVHIAKQSVVNAIETNRIQPGRRLHRAKCWSRRSVGNQMIVVRRLIIPSRHQPVGLIENNSIIHLQIEHGLKRDAGHQQSRFESFAAESTTWIFLLSWAWHVEILEVARRASRRSLNRQLGMKKTCITQPSY